MSHPFLVDVPLVTDHQPVHDGKGDKAPGHRALPADPRSHRAKDEEGEKWALDDAAYAHRELEDGAEVLDQKGCTHADQADDNGDYLQAGGQCLHSTGIKSFDRVAKEMLILIPRLLDKDPE